MLLVAVLLILMVAFVWFQRPRRLTRLYDSVAEIVVFETEQGEDHALCIGRPPSDGAVIGELLLCIPNRPEWDDAYLVVNPVGEDGLRVYEDGSRNGRIV
jgi:hypothetical protein